ncbi:MAG: hypothetical protein M0R38_09250 [Bacteroidia bacterium]|nr:hypothetical protein [Bacteroidia bacterium]
MQSADPKSKHIAKAAQANATTKALSKSLLCLPEKKNKKIFPASQKLNLPTHQPTDRKSGLKTDRTTTDGRRTTAYNIGSCCTTL